MTFFSRILRKTAISIKLPLAIALPSVILLMTAGTMLSLRSQQTVVDDHRVATETLLADRSAALENWLADASADLAAFSFSGSTIDAIRNFGNSWRPSKEGEEPDAYLRRLYITENEYPAGQKDELTTAGDKSAWTLRHKSYHPGFRAYQNARGYYDLFLFDVHGNLVYSVFKEDDFATNFLDGKYKDTGLGEAYRIAMELEPGQVHISGMESYAPSNGDPAIFMAAPVFRGTASIGVVAIQLPLTRVTAILGASGLLGESGIVYAVDDRNVAMSHSPHEGGHKALDALPESEVIATALSGASGYNQSAIGLHGQEVVAATDSIQLPNGKTWGLVLEIDASEAHAAEAELNLFFAVTGVIVALSVFVLSWLSARGVTKRVRTLSEEVTAISNHQYDTVVRGTDFKDEIGIISTTLEDFKTNLRNAEAVERAQEQKKIEQDDVVARLRSGLVSLADGDLTNQISEPFPEEHESLRVDFNKAVERLRDAVMDVVDSADSIRNGATEISQSSDDLSHRTEAQAATLEQTAAALDEITASVKSSAEGARGVERIVSDAKSEAEESGEIVQNAVSAMNAIEGSSNRITQIISVIDDIAFQTNLLALNAGVEAARAGEAGRGFAVVASEVQALAQRSADAASEIKALISESRQHVDQGVDLVGKTGEALDKIVERVSHITGLIGEIAEGASEQSTGLGEINTGMVQLDQVTQQNAAMVEEATAASQLLTSDANTLSSLMTRFKTGEGSSNTTPTAHGGTASTSFEFDPSTSQDISVTPSDTPGHQNQQGSNDLAPAVAQDGNTAKQLWQDF